VTTDTRGGQTGIAIPKRSFLTEYSCRIPPAVYPKLQRAWFDAAS